jgi:RNA polymerase sigma-70 factor (ECF subfamily)
MEQRMQEVDDWILAARARNGDQAAFTALVRRYERPIMHFCARMMGNAADAEDVAQECFLALHRSLERIEPRARFSTLLFGIARNLTLNHLRDGRRRGRHMSRPMDGLETEPASGDRPDHRAQAAEIGAVLAGAMDALAPEHREVLVLRELNQLDYEAIAEIVGCPIGTVRSRLARAREALRVRLVEQDMLP